MPRVHFIAVDPVIIRASFRLGEASSTLAILIHRTIVVLKTLIDNKS